jgi:hypothetical protein
MFATDSGRKSSSTNEGPEMPESRFSQYSWGRFYETISAEIYGQNLIWSNLCLDTSVVKEHLKRIQFCSQSYDFSIGSYNASIDVHKLNVFTSEKK